MLERIANQNIEINVFAYGSLVNTKTHSWPFTTAVAVMDGWVRNWSHQIKTASGKLCALTVEKDPACELLGLSLSGKASLLKHIDDREVGYKRRTVSIRLLNSNQTVKAYVYTTEKLNDTCPSYEYPIWMSYLDCVLMGYITMGGKEAGLDFISTTKGWNRPIINDRESPLYPRAIQLSEKEKYIIDSMLDTKGLIDRIITGDFAHSDF